MGNGRKYKNSSKSFLAQKEEIRVEMAEESTSVLVRDIVMLLYVC